MKNFTDLMGNINEAAVSYPSIFSSVEETKDPVWKACKGLFDWGNLKDENFEEVNPIDAAKSAYTRRSQADEVIFWFGPERKAMWASIGLQVLPSYQGKTVRGISKIATSAYVLKDADKYITARMREAKRRAAFNATQYATDTANCRQLLPEFEALLQGDNLLLPLSIETMYADVVAKIRNLYTNIGNYIESINLTSPDYPGEYDNGKFNEIYEFGKQLNEACTIYFQGVDYKAAEDDTCARRIAIDSLIAKIETRLKRL